MVAAVARDVAVVILVVVVVQVLMPNVGGPTNSVTKQIKNLQHCNTARDLKSSKKEKSGINFAARGNCAVGSLIIAPTNVAAVGPIDGDYKICLFASMLACNQKQKITNCVKN